MGIFRKIFMIHGGGVTYCNTYDCEHSCSPLAGVRCCQPFRFVVFSVFSAFSAFSACISSFLAGLIQLVCFIQYAFHAFARHIIKSVVSIMVVAAVCADRCRFSKIC